jgi:hypothetical protein
MSNQPSTRRAGKCGVKLSGAIMVSMLALIVPSPIMFSQSAKIPTSGNGVQLDSRTRTPDKSGDKTGLSGTQDDGFGVCPAFTHFHPLIGVGGATGGDPHQNPPVTLMGMAMDGLCHDDTTDQPVKERPKLPKPKFKPDPHNKWL